MSDLVLFCVDSRGSGVSLHGQAESLKASALERSALVGAVSDAASNAMAVEAMKGLKHMINLCENSRKKVKQPVLDLARAIDSTAAAFSADLTEEYNRISRACADFQTAELERVRAQERARAEEAARIERERQESLRRIEEEKRRAAEEAARKIEEARLEAERIAAAKAREEREQAERAAKAIADAEAAAAKTKAAREAAARRAAEEQARIEREAKDREEAERARIAAEAEAKAKAERERIEQEAAERAKAEQERSAQEIESLGPMSAPVRADGQTSKPVWLFEVVDVWTLARMHPGLVEITPRKQQINEVIASMSAAGDPKIAGLRIWQDVQVGVRAARTKTIDV